MSIPSFLLCIVLVLFGALGVSKHDYGFAAAYFGLSLIWIADQTIEALKKKQ